MNDPNFILGIETAVAGGSLSLCNAGTEITCWIGDEQASLRAEDLLIRIQRVLQDAGIGKKDLSSVAVTAGPGSFTGIRIGIATALAVKASLGIEFSSVSVLEAMAFGRNLTGIAAIPMGRGSACAQRFVDGIALGEAFNISADGLFDLETEGTFLIHSGLTKNSGAARTVNAGDNLAFAIATMASQRPAVVTSPVFLSRSIDK